MLAKVEDMINKIKVIKDKNKNKYLFHLNEVPRHKYRSIAIF